MLININHIYTKYNKTLLTSTTDQISTTSTTTSTTATTTTTGKNNSIIETSKIWGLFNCKKSVEVNECEWIQILAIVVISASFIIIVRGFFVCFSVL